jgi:hypothetical protein
LTRPLATLGIDQLHLIGSPQFAATEADAIRDERFWPVNSQSLLATELS